LSFIVQSQPLDANFQQTSSSNTSVAYAWGYNSKIVVHCISKGQDIKWDKFPSA